MDLYQYIEADHKQITKLFDLLENAPSERNQIEIIELISKELVLHFKANQIVFYKLLKQYNEFSFDVSRAEEAQNIILHEINKILSLNITPAAKAEKFLEIKKSFEQHVSEEENKIFKDAKKVLTDEEIVILKEQMHYQKAKLLNEVNIEITETELV